MHKAILIDPLNRTVTEVDQEPGLRPLYERLSVEGFRKCDDINAVGVSDRDAMYVDGEGMLIENLPVFGFLRSPATFAGRGLIVGTTGEGDDTDHSLNVDQVRASVVWTELQSTGHLTPGREVPAPAGAFAYQMGDPVLKDADE